MKNFYNILLISPEPWGENYVSKHHYAITLANQGNKVFFLNPPDKRIFKVSFSTYRNLFIIDYFPIFRGLRKLPGSITAWLTKIELRYLELRSGYNFDIIWNFETSRFFNLSKLPVGRIKISHIVDYTENFNLPLASATADICIGTSDYINKEQKNFNPSVHKIHHGVNINSGTSSVDFDSPYRIKVGYVGNLCLKYIDWKTVYELCAENKDTGFYFIGPEGKSNLGRKIEVDPYMNKVKQLINTFFLGAIPASEIPSYLDLFDILLLVYKADQYREQLANPHKLMEYIASGKITVASYTDEYVNKKELLEMVEDNCELPQRFRDVLHNLAHYNSEEKSALRKHFAFENIYEKQIDRIMQLIKDVV